MSKREQLTLQSFEYARTVGRQNPSSSTLRIRIPKIMAGISNIPERVVFNKSIFVNSPKCKINSGNVLKTQNFITVPKSPNCNLSYIATDDDYIPDNSLVTCACLYDSYITVIDAYTEEQRGVL